MKRKYIYFLLVLAYLLTTCKKDNGVTENQEKTYSFSGNVQKGPFAIGTNITLNELNGSFSQTGKAFTTTITDDDGRFSLQNITLASSLVLVTANGFYYNEMFDEVSTSPLILHGYADIHNSPKIYINVLTDLIKGRIEQLTGTGLSFADASQQSQKELISFFGADNLNTNGFEQLDISNNSSEGNAFLLAVSVMVQRVSNNLSVKPTLVGELSQLLARISNDFKPDGKISDVKIIDTLLYNIGQANLTQIRSNIENKYKQLYGNTVIIPDFEKYITMFQKKYSVKLTTSIEFPDTASPYPATNPTSKIQNLLAGHDSIYKGNNAPYSFAAIVPYDSILTVNFIFDDSTTYNYGLSPPYEGWDLLNQSAGAIIFRSNQQNMPIGTLLYLRNASSGTIKYYKNNSTIPYRMRHIKWQ